MQILLILVRMDLFHYGVSGRSSMVFSLAFLVTALRQNWIARRQPSKTNNCLESRTTANQMQELGHTFDLVFRP